VYFPLFPPPLVYRSFTAPTFLNFLDFEEHASVEEEAAAAEAEE